MPEITPSLARFSQFQQVGGTDDRFKLSEQNTLETDGKRQIGNVFARAWNWLNRSSEQVEANKHTTREFIRSLQDTYGREVAQMASRELSTHLSRGRPLTGHRIEQVMNKAERLSHHIQTANRQVLDRCVDQLLTGAMERRFGGQTDTRVLDRDQARELVRQAIEQHPDFSQRPFQNVVHVLMDQFGEDGHGLARQEFIQHFGGVADQAVERGVAQQLLPHSTAVRDTHGQEGLQTAMRNAPEETQMRIQQAEAFVNYMKEGLAEDSGPLTGDRAAVYLGMIEGLQAQADELSLVPRDALSPTVTSYLDALTQDMQVLEQALGERLGLDAFTQPQQEALLQANRLKGGLTQITVERAYGRLGEESVHLATGLRAALTTLQDAEPDTPESRLVLQTLLDGSGEAHAIARDFPLAVTAGLTRQELSALQDRGLSLKDSLGLVGQGGFDQHDVAWIRHQGLDVVDTLARFTPAEARLLHGAGLGVELGLQYKDKDIPIHARTLVTDFHQDLVVGEPVALTGGQVSRPYEVMYGDERRVFKEPQRDPLSQLESGYGPTAGLLGIDREHSQMAVRNIATQVVDELLGFELVPDTQIGTLDGRLGVVMDFAQGTAPVKDHRVDVTSNVGHVIYASMQEEDEANVQDMLDAMGATVERGPFDVTDTEDGRAILQGLAGDEHSQMQAQALLQQLPGEVRDGRVVQMIRVHQAQPQGVEQVDFTDPALRRALVQLQLLDALTAQGDRHQGNYIVQLGEGGRFERLQAIDNDQAFGTRVIDPNQLLRRTGGQAPTVVDGRVYGTEGFNGVCLPEVVDRDMKNTFDTLTHEDLRAALGGLLPDKEVEACLLRLGAIKAHLNRLEEQGRVIEPNQWGSERATQYLQDPNTSYVGRDHDYVRSLPQVRYEDVRR